MRMTTQVGIIGAGPAGLLLAHLLHVQGIESVVIENRSRAYIEKRVRAGVLEHGAMDTLIDAGVGERMLREGLLHHGIELRFNGRGHRIDLTGLTGGRAIRVYGQQEIVKDLIAVRLKGGLPLLFEVGEASIHELESSQPLLRFVHNDENIELTCDVIAGCDGFHGICRPSVPANALQVFDHTYPFAWLGILALAAPTHDELIYACHDDGFALYSMRSPDVTRLYLQVAPDEDIDAWSDERIWRALHSRLETDDGWTLNEGPVLEKGVTGMRSYVTEPMQYGRLFLAGDAAHIVPPTGAKGMNLAMADVRVLAQALASFYKTGSPARLAGYSATCLKRVWRAEHFSWWMTSMLHRFPDADAFARRLQRSQLDYVVSSLAASTSLAENYVGLPFADA
jgi:p-hydroxybenzoate 3-monooxygenase